MVGLAYMEAWKFWKRWEGTCPMVQWLRLPTSNAGDVGSIPGQGTKIPHASGTKNQNIKQKQYCNEFNKAFKVIHLKKKSLKKKEV